MRPADYAGGVKDIRILPESAKHVGDWITESERYVLRSELGKLMWVAGIARPGALYDDAADAPDFEDVETALEIRRTWKRRRSFHIFEVSAIFVILDK